MNNPKVKWLLLLAGFAALAAIGWSFAAGSHFHLGWDDGRFSFDFRVGTGHSAAAAVLGFIALVAGLAGGGLYFSTNPTDGTTSTLSGVTTALRQLTTSDHDCWLGGVCGGLGEHTPLPSWVWRVTFLLLLLGYGTGLLLYIVLWICLPEPPRRNVAAGATTNPAPGSTH